MAKVPVCNQLEQQDTSNGFQAQLLWFITYEGEFGASASFLKLKGRTIIIIYHATIGLGEHIPVL
jgi:hypothetical protein